MLKHGCPATLISSINCTTIQEYVGQIKVLFCLQVVSMECCGFYSFLCFYMCKLLGIIVIKRTTIHRLYYAMYMSSNALIYLYYATVFKPIHIIANGWFLLQCTSDSFFNPFQNTGYTLQKLLDCIFQVNMLFCLLFMESWVV